MKKQTAIFFLLVVFISLQCTDLALSDWGRVSIFVYWQQDTGVPGKKVEIIETGEIRYTDKRGTAEFDLAPGTYTVRVYAIERGGCCLVNVDNTVALKPSASKFVFVFER